MPNPANRASTRNRLLDAAAVIFAKKGFTDATVAEICDDAGANISAVNYHFGSKEELYKAAWLYAFEQALPKQEQGTPAPDASAEEHLRFQIATLIGRIADPANHVFAIMEHEFANPTGVLRDIIPKALTPHKSAFNSHIGALLGEDATAEAVDLCRASIIAQCFHMSRLMKLHETHGDLADFSRLDAKSYAEHVYRFSLGGIKALKEERS